MLVSPLEGYTMWAATYDSTPNPLLALERRVMKNVLHGVRGKRAIDVACGSGYWTRTLRQAGAIVFGFDNCPAMIGQTRGGAYFLADALAIPIRNATADITLCSMAASYFADLSQAISEMSRITRPGGRVILSDMHPAAMAAGWKRSFSPVAHALVRAASGLVSTQAYEIRHQPWTEESLLSAGRAARLAPQHHFDEAFAEPERPLFAAAQREHLFDDLKRIPAVRITTWIRL